MADETLLCQRPKINVAKCRSMIDSKQKDELTDFIRARFTERYIIPIKNTCREHKNGFCTMAICCLMIEALESFREGLPETPWKEGAKTFERFFQRIQNKSLAAFKDQGKDFYECIRNGILHQAETKNGWTIHRKGKLFNSVRHTINATRFHNAIAECLDAYCNELQAADWTNDIWKKCVDKLNSVIKNCEAKPA